MVLCLLCGWSPRRALSECSEDLAAELASGRQKHSRALLREGIVTCRGLWSSAGIVLRHCSLCVVSHLVITYVCMQTYPWSFRNAHVHACSCASCHPMGLDEHAGSAIFRMLHKTCMYEWMMRSLPHHP